MRAVGKAIKYLNRRNRHIAFHSGDDPGKSHEVEPLLNNRKLRRMRESAARKTKGKYHDNVQTKA